MARSAKVNPVPVQKFLSDVDYPATKDELIECAQDHGADEAIIETLRRLPMDRFISPDEVAEAIGELE